MILRGRTMFDPTKWRVVGELTHMRSVCVGVAETGGINAYAKRVCWRRRDRGRRWQAQAD